MRWSLLILGGLMAVVGGTWLLQGVGILPGSFMTGQVFWAVVGAIVLVSGAAGLPRRAAWLASRVGVEAGEGPGRPCPGDTELEGDGCHASAPGPLRQEGYGPSGASGGATYL